ncbi:MAG: tetratricopeptide repeat protein [Treponema sp.]|nr:tetratricopeptide repeat protein [Treponema sp.]
MQNNREMQNQQKDSDSGKVPAGEKINDFIQNNRKGIIAAFAVFVLVFVGFIAYFFISDNLNKQAIAEVEELNRRFIDLQQDIQEGSSTDMTEKLLADLIEFAQKKSKFPGSKAWSLAGQIYSQRKDWALAEEAWLNAAKSGEKTYLGPIALFQAAAVCEEQGKYERAIELYRECVSHPFEFPAAPRAQFSIGRLNEQIGNFPDAIEAYRAVTINWPEIPVWQNLARSRITAIEIR